MRQKPESTASIPACLIMCLLFISGGVLTAAANLYVFRRSQMIPDFLNWVAVAPGLLMAHFFLHMSYRFGKSAFDRMFANAASRP